MKISKNLLKPTPLLAVLIGLVLLSALIFANPLPRSSVPLGIKTITPNKQQEDKPTETNSGLPIRLLIPKISVNAAIAPMGVLSDGNMEAPSGPQDTGWYKFGTRPGDSGSAVIAGHYGPWRNGEESVFDNLNKLSKGDNLYIKDEKGTTTTFVVRELRTYRQNEVVPAVFISNDGKAHLNLITCQGVWNETQKSYSTRLVVFADEEIQ